MTDGLTLKILAEIAAPGSGHLFSRREAARSAIALIEQQAARIAELEALLVKANDAWLAMSKIATVAPAVDAQPVGVAGAMPGTDGFTMAVFKADDIPIGTALYTSAQSEGLRKDAEELLRRIPTTPEQMIDFIGSHFDSMEAQEWSEFSGEARAKPAGDLSMVRYSLTVHDLLSAFDWADLSEYAIDAALSQHTGEKDD